MQEQNGLNPVERELELALQSLSPAAARIDPIAAAFKAGRESARPQLHAWQSAAAGLLLAGIALWVVSSEPSSPTQTADRVPIAMTLQYASAPKRPLTVHSVVMLQAAMNQRGLSGLPATHVPSVQVIRSNDVL